MGVRNALFIGINCDQAHVVPVPLIAQEQAHLTLDNMDISPWIQMRKGVTWWAAPKYTKTYSAFTADDHQPPNTAFTVVHYGQYQYYRKKNHYVNTIRQRQYQTWYGAVLVFKLNWSGDVVNVTRADLPVIQRLLAL